MLGVRMSAMNISPLKLFVSYVLMLYSSLQRLTFNFILVAQRIVNVTKIPIPNSEHLQILRYRSDQFYESHHDFIDHHVERPCGPRILTFFLYLSDVQSGGGTLFNELDITIMPKVGRALLWPSVLSENLNKKDFRTDHEALPVVEGTKFAANAWLHLRDFRGWVDRGCA